MSHRARRRFTPASPAALEARLLLAGNPPTGTWLGQDAHDLVGPSSTPGASGVQDIHIAIAGLPAARTITFADVSALGGGDWQVNGPFGPWAGVLSRTPGSTSADLYIEPYQVETGRSFLVGLTYDDGTSADFWLQGGAADPNLRMPSVTLAAAWGGQGGRDGVGLGPSVGPDGIQDARISLTKLSPGIDVQSVTVDGPPGASWRYGVNREAVNNADLILDASDSTKADLYIAPDRDLSGTTLTVTLVYANGKTDRTTLVAGRTQPGLAMPATPILPTIRPGLSASWIGQDGTQWVGPGDVRAAVAGLPTDRAVVAASLSDLANNIWTYVAAGFNGYVEPYSTPLAFRRPSPTSTTAELGFPPMRDEAGSPMTLRLQFDDGSIAVAVLAGGTVDVGLRSPELPAATSVVAHPGDDLNDLANRFGRVHLTAGDYALNRPLVLTNPVTIDADPGARLVFTQPAGAPAWTAAIKIHRGHTTLSGFSVRFTGVVRWDWGVNFGPALIGTTDERDPSANDPKAAVVLTGLDLQSPPAAGAWEEAPRLIRVTSASAGRIVGNTLKGGSIELNGGPWIVTDNAYRGTPSNTYAYTVFSLSNTHDVTIARNVAQPTGPSGKTWRFLVQTGRGANDLIDGNTVRGIGPMDGDAVPNPNAAEIILTEAYTVSFEGNPSRISVDGRILQVRSTQGNPPRSGDGVAILNGPAAGQWRRIVAVLDPRTYLLDLPLPQGSYAVSISGGFVNETYSNNTVDARGSSAAGDLVLLGTHFGTRVLSNYLLGGAAAFKIAASPTESPAPWGWSHTPFFGAAIDGNTIDDALGGGIVSVEHSAAIKSNKGRVYFSGTLTGTSVGWSAGFLAANPSPPGLTIGDVGSIDPAELLLSASNNTLRAPAGAPAGAALRINSAQWNGALITDLVAALDGGGIPNPDLPAPLGFGLVNDTGYGPYDTITYDPRMRFNPVAGAVGYEYRLGDAGPFTPLGNATAFTPAGLVQGFNSVTLRAYDARGGRGIATSFPVRLDTVPPVSAAPSLSATSDTGRSNADRITAVARPEFNLAAEATDAIVLYRDGIEIGRRTGPGPLRDPGVPGDGAYTYTALRTDAAGNTALSDPTVVVVDTTIPAPPANPTASSDGSVRFTPTEPTETFEYRLESSTAYIALGEVASFTPLGVGAGPRRVYIRGTDAAGNLGAEASVVVGAGSTPPEPQTPAGLWRGQDGRDLVGKGPVGKPDGLQDIHISVSGLRTDARVVRVDVRPIGGGEWAWNGPFGPWKAAWLQNDGETTAELFVQPYQVERGRSFGVTVTYDDGTTAAFWVRGGVALPNRRVPIQRVRGKAIRARASAKNPAPRRG